MTNPRRVLIGMMVATLVGATGGYALGWWQKAGVERRLRRSVHELKRARKVEATLRRSLQSVREQSLKYVAAQSATEQALLALVQLHENNFGLARQHLGACATELGKLQQVADEPLAAHLAKLQLGLKSIQTLVLRLSPEAHREVGRLVSELRQLPRSR